LVYIEFVLSDKRLSACIAAKRSVVLMQLHVQLQTKFSEEFFVAQIALKLGLFVHDNVAVQLGLEGKSLWTLRTGKWQITFNFEENII